MKKFKGAGWCKKDDVFCSEILESKDLRATLSGLNSEIEKLKAVILLVKSSRNSIGRTKDKSKPTYFRKSHEFKDRHIMTKALIADHGFMKDWIAQYQFYNERNMRLDYRPTIGRKNHDMGYTKDNVEAVPYSQNTSDRAVERFSTPCIAVVATKTDSTATVFECPSVVNSIARIDEVMQLGVTRNMMQGNLSKGIRRVTEDYSIFIIGRNRILNDPMVVDMGIPVSVVTNDVILSYVHKPKTPKEAKSHLKLNIDELGDIYVKFVAIDEGVKEAVAA
ncbi:hypothetical protein F4V43_18655 [Paenibacillus spiritus]|uniref:Uncharacterized protein n=1 Tax=Paenibacillus spiritus TaxID=2496557 RepID=A0A5J5FSI3_9BACL|nr:hypothetical protein [Paenibacillus spiritus]KAA8996332.1 hypothetical protein F4V43_18655 [Paenibacillus spiritus]